MTGQHGRTAAALSVLRDLACVASRLSPLLWPAAASFAARCGAAVTPMVEAASRVPRDLDRSHGMGPDPRLVSARGLLLEVAVAPGE